MIKLLFRSLKDIRRIAPQLLIMQVVCMMLQSVLVAVNTWLVAVFLNHVYSKDLKISVIYLGIIWGIFVVSEVANSVFYACMVKIDSKVGMKLAIELGEKGGRLSLIQYEDLEINNRLKRAQNCIEHGRFSDLSVSIFNILAEILKVGNTLFILVRFSPLLALVSLLSVIPYFIVRLIRGKEFYELKKYQSAGERRRNYLYHLFGDKRVVKELRIFGIESYIEEKLYQTRDEMNQELWDFKKRDICSFSLCEILCKCGYMLSIIKGKFNKKKRFGKSIKNRCPSGFQTTVEKKFKVTGGAYIEVPNNYRASQYDHTADDYIKKKLSDRLYRLRDGTLVQRDWYSSFLLYCYDYRTQEIDKDKCITDFGRCYDKEKALIAWIKANHIKILNSGIKVA